MQRFWDTIIEPLLAALDPSVVVEVGAQHGGQTDALLEFVRDRDAILHCIDPVPQFDVAARLAEFGHRFVFHETLSLNVLGTISAPDAVLIDGDHNWYTVTHELGLLARTSAREGRSFPLTLLHDTGWPYGRRDLYYDPETIPAAYRLPHRRAALDPSTPELVEKGGLNGHLENAIYEHDLRNGVLTAVEDFMAEAIEPLRLISLPGGHGLSLVVSEAALGADERLSEAVRRLESPAFTLEHATWIERARVEQLITAAEHERTAQRAQARAEELEGDLRDAAERVESLQGRLEDAEQFLAASASEATEAQQAASQARDEAQTQAARAQAAESLIEELRAETRRAAQRHAQLDDELGHARQAAEQQQTELTAAKTTIEQHTARHAAHCSRLERQLAELHARQREVERQHADELSQARATDREQALAVDRAFERIEGELARVSEMTRRVGASRSWRLGNWIMRLGRRLTFRRPKGSGALPLLTLHVERARGVALARVAEGRTDLAIASTTGPVSRPAKGGADLARPAAEVEERRAARELLNLWTTTFGAPTFERTPVPPADRGGVLRTEHPAADRRSVDVVVCVHDALMDLHRCLQSLLEKTSMPFRLIVVDDGSGDETAEYLRRFLARTPAAGLIRNRSERHGYTIAANLGLRESRGEYVVLLNSDTIVTPGWLEGLVECAEGDERVGIVGPLSNAASHQSVPQARDNGDWAVNPLPHWLTEDGMALVLASLPGDDRVVVPFLNGFCYVMRRRTIEAVGLLDEETFGQGYSEENDYSRRAAAAGFELVVAPRSYVFHAKSRSYGHEERKVIAKAQYRKFLAKHGEAKVRTLVEGLEGDATLAAIRDRAQRALSAPGAALELLPRLRVMFVVPGLSAGGSGGSHSIYQEVSAMRSVGIEAGIAVGAKAWQHALAAYPDAETLFTPFADEAALAEVCRASDVVVATHHVSAPWVERLAQSRPDMLPAYYVQDYEPFFTASDWEQDAEVRRSYSAIPSQVVFAKTRWLCESVAAAEGVVVHKVEPSLDRAVYRAGPPRDLDRPVRVVAMLRPRTPRRAPVMTLSVLRRLSQEVGGKVEIETFGCPTAALDGLGGLPEGAHHHGILSRESVAEVLRSADVFVDCSWYQAFGRTALEAMACGATALVPRLGGADEFAVHDVNAVVVDTLDDEAILDALLTLVSDRARLGRLQETAARTAADYSTMRAGLAEYVLFQRAYAERASRQEANSRPTESLRG